MNVLFLTHRLPYAPNRGDRIRAFYLLREMSRFAHVTLFSLVHDDEEKAHVKDVPFAARVATASVPRLANLTRGAMRLPTARPLTHSLLDSPDTTRVLTSLVNQTRPDVVVAYCSGMAKLTLAPPLADLPCVLDMVDVDSSKWHDLGQTSRHVKRWIYQREARTLAAFEVLAVERAHAVTVVSERERDALVALTGRSDIQVVPNGVDLSAFRPTSDPSTEPVVVFSGVMDYGPNVEAVTRFVQRIWPLVKRERPDARFVIAGARPTRGVQSLADGDASIEITGQVPRVQPYLWRAAVSVAPIDVARGVQNKVLEALAAGLPTVVSPAVAAGLPRGVERGCRVAADETAFADSVVTLLGCSPDERRAIAESADVQTLGWEQQLAAWPHILQGACSSPVTPAGTRVRA